MTKLVPIDAQVAEEIDRDGDAPTEPKVGRWFHVSETKKLVSEDVEHYVPDKPPAKPWLGCVVHVGSNFAELSTVGGGTERIHLDEFLDRCERILDPAPIIDGKIAYYLGETRRLMAKVMDLTRRLGIAPTEQLGDGAETQAIATQHAANADLKAHKRALIKAKEKTLPELFKEIEHANARMATWMKAKLIPLKAEVEQLKPAIEKIEQRIFSVELYAGLVETVKQITDGQPAPLGEPIHLMQRRCYMDEECLACYEAGGMEFKNIGAFHRWLARPVNRDRILPFPRCVVAFQVRREAKEREWHTPAEFFEIIELEKADRYTYLYLRNGEQVFCLATEINFEEKLFPDIDRQQLAGELYARMFAGSVDEVIPEHEYQGLVEEYEAETERWRDNPADRYVKFEPNCIYYDDILEHVQSEVNKHNRLVLVLQGLLDRSPVFHPHPPWQLWTPAGFGMAIKLHYDDSRALVDGDKPDFKAYCERLRASITTGTVVMGQEDVWERREAERENDRRRRSWRSRPEDYRHTHFRPYGNPGPGLIARVGSMKGDKARFEWERERTADWNRRKWVPNPDKPGYLMRDRSKIPDAIEVPREKLFNIDAYTPGDFHQFFDDPRTRAEYLRWAPFLLTAEDYHAGKRTLESHGKRVERKRGRRRVETDEGDE